MAGRPRRRARIKAALALQRDSGGSSDDDTGLSLFPRDAEGSGGGSGLRSDEQERGQHPPLHDDVGGRAADVVGQDRSSPVLVDGGGLRPRRNRYGEFRKAGPKISLSRLEDTGSPVQSGLANGHRQEVDPTVAGIAEARVRNGDALLTNSAKLTRAVELSLERALDILEIKPDPQNKNY